MANQAVHEWNRQLNIVTETTYGVDPTTGYLKIVCENRPMFDPGYDTPKATGDVGRGYGEDYALDFVTGLIKPKITGLKMRADDANSYKFIRAMTQQVPTKTGVGPWVYTWLAPTAQCPNTGPSSFYYGLMFQGTVEPAVAQRGEAINGGVCPSVKFSFRDDGSPIYVEPAILGQSWKKMTVGGAGAQLLGITQWMGYQAGSFSLGAYPLTPYAGEIELSTGLEGQYYNQQSVVDWGLGKLRAKGSLTLPGSGSSGGMWGYYAYHTAATNSQLQFGLNYPNTNSSLMITADVFLGQPTFGKTAGGIETVTFPFVSANNGSGIAINLYSSANLT